MNQPGFVDLRQNGGSQGLGESFWPSFTDIMTVVVMIFIITSTVLIVRNWELVAELRSTMEAEREAAALAQATRKTNETLEEQLVSAQHQLSELRIRNMQLHEQNRERQQRLSEQAQTILALRTERQQLETEVQTAERSTQMLSEQLAQAQAQQEQLKAEYGQQQTRLKKTVAELQALERTHRQNLADLGELRQQKALYQERLSALEDEYAALDKKYQKLILPARTASGKQVVEVRYRSVDGKRQIQMRAPGESEYRQLSEEALHQRLGGLKKRLGKELYVKIIIPSDSGLSYNEAWEFTRTLLDRYDYYYQQ